MINEQLYQHLKQTNQLCYRNNPKSLFRKYARLLAVLTKHQLFRDYLGHRSFKLPKNTVLLLPNGFRQFVGREKDRVYYQTIISSRTTYSRKLYPLLQFASGLKKAVSPQDFQEFIAWSTGLIKRMPAMVKVLLPLYSGLPIIPLTVTTKYPDPDPETTTVDGGIRREPADTNTGESLATIRAGAGTAAYPSLTSLSSPRLQCAAVTNPNFRDLIRDFALFDTSSIPDTDTIDSANLSVASNATSGLNNAGSADLHAAASTPASNTDLATSDFTNVGTTTFGNIAYASWNNTDTTYNAIALNASGLAAISKIGVSKFSLQLNWDINNSFGGSWSADADSKFGIYFADQTGTATDPKLAVTHSAPATGAPWELMMIGVGR